jgi:hypothetical protein
MSRADSRRVPADQIDCVVKALYAGADRLDWAHLPPQQRTAQYDKWVEDPEIGGALTSHMPRETARSWIKDGPMKEYARAQQGAGRYARFGSPKGLTSEQVVRHALGRGSRVVGDSEGVKPFHCLGASSDGEQTYLAWGEAKNFRYLVWACLNHVSQNPNANAAIVVTETMSDPTTSSEKARLHAIATRCGVDLKYYRAATPKRSTEGGAS